LGAGRTATSVASRANYRCEYCLIHEDDSYLGFEVDHVISAKHGGQTNAENLTYACFYCNRYKGSDIGTIVPGSRRLVPLFNPRTDDWVDHFEVVASSIEGKSEIGKATVRILEFNLRERLLERHTLLLSGNWPAGEQH
jgi:hypothetical protein